MQNFNEKTKQRLINWWNFEKTDKPIILATYCNETFPKIFDMDEYWENNCIRYDIFLKMLKSSTFLGEALPTHYIDFGASAMAGALGCKMNPLTFDTIWPNHLFVNIPMKNQIQINPDNEWYKKLYELFNLSLDNPNIMTTFYALGGINDTFGSLYGEQNLLMDMYDDPEKVHNCLEKICDIWIAEKEKMWNIIKEKQEGMSSWAGIWAPGSTFPIQDDISYMLSSEMFIEFCLPYIKRCIDSLDYPLYHLDGPGAITHLDCLLEIKNLKAIQWVPGAGNEEITQWYPLIKKILEAKKSVQVFCTVDETTPLIYEVGTRGLLIKLTDANLENINKIKNFL